VVLSSILVSESEVDFNVDARTPQMAAVSVQALHLELTAEEEEGARGVKGELT
jgi:hypothetical protein